MWVAVKLPIVFGIQEMNKIKTLTVADHSRSFKNCVYVYPVVSRRAEGVSLGLNLNVNNACNWRCVYCQVEGLVRGKPERIDLDKLESELDLMLDWIINGDFIQKYAAKEFQRFNDICLSGNGESTLSKDFAAVCRIIAKLRSKYHIGSDVKTILITNGSEMQVSQAQEGIQAIAANYGELWFKIDRATPDAISTVNQVNLHLDGILDKLSIASKLCPTWIQSCWFATNNIEPTEDDINAFVKLVAEVKSKICGVLIYSTARNPALPEGHNISQVSTAFLHNLEKRIAELGVMVKCYL